MTIPDPPRSQEILNLATALHGHYVAGNNERALELVMDLITAAIDLEAVLAASQIVERGASDGP